MLKFIIGLYVRLVYAKRALQRINQPHLGDTVIYKGQEHLLIQGVANPCWDLMSLSEENMAKRPARDVERRVHVSDFQLQPLYKRFVFSFMFTYNFYMKAWFSIDVNNKGRFIFIGN